ncbi:MAG: arsenate reductase [Rhodobacteraceae bacterium HLUCCO18]|nr:MAG: arsenate reductase [Rhodobacteraceae bacterium HLUCCO18]
MELEITNRLSALGHPQRLAILRLLMRRFPDRLPAGDISRALDLKASTLSNYLSHLMQVGLVTQERSGTSLLYAPDMDALRGTVGYLFNDCCRGRPDLCPPIAPATRPGADPMSQDPFRVLFICTGNSARSIFAETLLRELGGGRFDVHSAGTKPRSELNPFAVKVLEAKGHDVSGLRSKTVAEYQGPEAVPFDFVFTVCDRAANEECPPWPGQPVSGHWGLPDPVQVEGTDAERALAFQAVYGSLRNRILALVALPFDALDAMSLQRAVDDIGKMDDEVRA